MSTGMTLQKALFDYCLRIGDTSLILGQRLAEWCGHAPILEEDIALSNLSLDLIGQSRIMLTYAGQVEGEGKTEDDLAFFRDARQYRNLRLSELPNGDFAKTITRLYFISAYNYYVYSLLETSTDQTLSAFAGKSVKEVAYHLRHSRDWVLRLGDGTDESHEKIQNAVNELWDFVEDMFRADEIDNLLHENKIAPDLMEIRQKWDAEINDTFSKARLTIPQVNSFMRTGSREGNHTEHLGYILAEMQFLPRAYPDASW
jgi:ring-1,2-phenylacetyl-CoA epoxidase subunit PaaC